MVLSKFESFSPELFVEISDYLDGCDLYYALHGLNQRINIILDQNCHRLHVSFIRISKIKFDLYCNIILPHICQRIVSLTLCGNDSSTPGQLELFLSHFDCLANFFIKLESFKLIDYIKSDVQILLPQLPTLNHLKCLSIGDYKRLMPFNVKTNELFNENIILPISLRNLAFPYEISNEWIQTLNATELFVEHLHVHLIHMNSLSFFLQRFPYLKRLTAVLTNYNQNNLQIGNMSSAIITFHALRYLNVNITSRVHFDQFAWFLRNVPQLHSLSVEALNPKLVFLEASRWETILPINLSLFRFDLTMSLPNNPNHLEYLKPFKSDFWISRGWFVQCHLRDRGRFFRLSTVQSPIITILYWPDDEVLLDSTTTIIYSNVTHIELWWNLSKSTQSICPNVRSIRLYGVSHDDETLNSNVCDILKCQTLEHIIISDHLPITPERFASVLVKSSDNFHILTCSARWLIIILENTQYEWICLLLTICIRKLIIIDETIVLHSENLIKFCRTFLNLQEIIIKINLIEDLFYILNNLEQLTMANIELPDSILNNVNDIKKWIQDNTILMDFTVRKQITELNTCKLILWIGTRRTSNSLISKNDL